MSADLPLPKQVFGHGFLLNRGQKESKSLGNVTDPIALAEQYGVDTLRYFLLREVAFGQDGSYSPEAIVTRANAELANSFGNLAQRSLSMIFKNMDGDLRTPSRRDDADADLEANVCSHISGMRARFTELAFSDGLEAWMRAVFACNQYVDEQAPWTLRKTDPDRMAAVLLTLFRCVRDLAIAVRPVVPEAADNLLDQMGVAASQRDFAALDEPTWFTDLTSSGFRVVQPVGVFPRLELPPEDA
jgi:methionyl-tRNA synthetase